MYILPYMLPVLLTASAASIARSKTVPVDDITIHLDGPTTDGSAVGTGELAKAAKSAADDMIKWFPWKTPQASVEIEKNKCNPWTISSPTTKDEPKKLLWPPQVTAPMPLEALYSIMKVHSSDGNHILNGYLSRTDYSIFVTKAYFTPVKNLDKAALSDDVLAFCSLVLSYAKSAATPLMRDESPKLRTPFMPRNDFATLYNQVKPKLNIPLFPLFEQLACYKKRKDGKLDLVFKNEAAKSGGTMSIKAWIEGIASNKDLLTTFDKSIDGSIGGLGTKTEKMYKGTRAVPLFEFRDLDAIKTSEIENFMTNIDKSIQTLHDKYKAAPK
ncbi:hypothetical protein BDV26DRAFT_284449 [Aspergillus bertholletiae]|uniref:Uncharacterized protein n=1 Tax=Aspergillus bertholletiae TaxID=1226010 RepID=A0A5N7AWL2_9EURO|nr:hypothetical protein BDV26DRAFT_284449 [Aspergillus bertholletiae]